MSLLPTSWPAICITEPTQDQLVASGFNRLHSDH